MKRQSSHDTGVALVHTALETRNYIVSKADKRTGADLIAVNPNNREDFSIVVSSLWTAGTTWWMAKKELRDRLFYILVAVGEGQQQPRFFVLAQPQLNELIDQYQAEHPGQQPLGGFSWRYALRFENLWNNLPGSS